MIKIIQECDGCGQERQLELFRETGTAAVDGGWVKVDQNKHLCKKCVQLALRRVRKDEVNDRHGY